VVDAVDPAVETVPIVRDIVHRRRLRLAFGCRFLGFFLFVRCRHGLRHDSARQENVRAPQRRKRLRIVMVGPKDPSGFDRNVEVAFDQVALHRKEAGEPPSNDLRAPLGELLVVGLVRRARVGVAGNAPFKASLAAWVLYFAP
jgi:hypothetical protein